MHAFKKVTIAAAALILSAGVALAECPDGQFEYFTHTGTGTELDPFVAVQNCRKTADHGGDVAWTGNPADHLTPVLHDHDGDPLTPDEPLVIDGKPIVSGTVNDWAKHHHDKPVVKGINGVAVGDGSMVGQYVTFINDNGTPEDPTDDFEDKKIVFANNGTAIGAGSHVTHDNSTALGAGAKSTDDHQVTLGTKDETIRAEGITSEKSKARQVGPTELVTSDSGGRLATDGGETFRQINANSDAIASHGVRLDELDKGLAISMAMPDAWLSDTKKFGIFGSVGGYNGETALGFAAIGRIDETWSINGKLGTDTDFEQFGWQVGAGAQW